MERRDEEVDKGLFDRKLIEGFLEKTEEEKYEIVKQMPLGLQLELLGDAGALDDSHTTISHPHELQKITSQDNRPNWKCSREVSGDKCKNNLSDEHKPFVIGYQCIKGESCKEDDKYAICVKCAIVEGLVTSL